MNVLYRQTDPSQLDSDGPALTSKIRDIAPTSIFLKQKSLNKQMDSNTNMDYCERTWNPSLQLCNIIMQLEHLKHIQPSAGPAFETTHAHIMYLVPA